jgi:hypothetical protein
MGRPPIGERPLTAAEKMRRYRARKFGNKPATKFLPANAAARVRELERERDHYKARVDELEAASQRPSSDATELAAACRERDDAPVSLEKLRPAYEKAIADQNGMKTNPLRRDAPKRWSGLDGEKSAETRRGNAARPREDVRTDREIVEDILKEARKAGVEMPDTRVYELIERVRKLKLYGTLNGNRKSNRRHAKKIIAWIDEGKQLFALYDENFPWDFIFTPDAPPEQETRSFPLTDDDRIEVIRQKSRERHGGLGKLVGEMRWKCKWIIDHRVGAHGGSGHPQEWAAMASRILLESVEIPLRYGSPRSTYRETSSLFFEAMTGTYGVDLERACRAIAKRRFDEGPYRGPGDSQAEVR